LGLGASGRLGRRHADLWPASTRSPGAARLPSTRSCPVRAQRDTMLKLASGKVPLEPAVEADAVVVRADGEQADVAHAAALPSQ
jgi:hypothetical protein